jgi:hypothetical protein|tara:strand:- start:14 stop:199 length:186 start_codon:yes stop_codon:yes gene_type:complete
LHEDKQVLAKVVIDNKTKEVKIILGQFKDENSMITAAQIICEHLDIDFIPELPSFISYTIH